MKIIRECTPNWNNYPIYFPQISDSCQDLSKWHNQTWQGWINAEPKSSYYSQPYSYSEKLKISKYNLYKDFGDEVILWNTSSGAVIILTKDEYKIISYNLKYLELNISEDCSLVIAELIRLGFIVNAEEIESLKLDFIRNLLSSHCSNVKNFIILPTTACNGRCFYCFAHNDIAKFKTMDST